MTAAPKRTNPCTLHAAADGDGAVLVATWPQRRYRYLLDDGSTVDVLTQREDSDLRDALLTFTGAQRIAGVVEVTAP